MPTHLVRRGRSLALVPVALVAAACSDSNSVAPPPPPESLTLTSAQVSSLDSSAMIVRQANPGNSELQSLVDSTLLVLTAGVQAKRLDVTTNLTSAPLYFVGIHRAVNRLTGAYSTWTLVGFDSPSQLANIVEVSGFAQTASGGPPTAVTGPVGNGIVNSLMLQVGAAGAVTEWRADAGSATFSSDAAGAACPGFTATPIVTCAIETMHVHFSASASAGSNGATARQASLGTDIDVPTMRLTYNPPQ